jgi:hypothetical protein
MACSGIALPLPLPLSLPQSEGSLDVARADHIYSNQTCKVYLRFSVMTSVWKFAGIASNVAQPFINDIILEWLFIVRYMHLLYQSLFNQSFFCTYLISFMEKMSQIRECRLNIIGDQINMNGYSTPWERDSKSGNWLNRRRWNIFLPVLAVTATKFGD